MGCHVEQAFDDVEGFGTPSASIGVGWGRVGEDRVHREVDDADVVDAGGNPGADQNLDDDAYRTGVSAHVGQGSDAIAEHFPVAIQRQFSVRFHVPAVGGAEELVQAGGDPFDRTPQFPGGVNDDDVFRIEAAF